MFNRACGTTALRAAAARRGIRRRFGHRPVRSGDHYTFSSFATTRRRAERRAADSETRYRTVVENVNEGITGSAAGRIRSAYRQPARTGADGGRGTPNRGPSLNSSIRDDRDLVFQQPPAPPAWRGWRTTSSRVVHRDGNIVWLGDPRREFEWQGAPTLELP